MHRGQPVLNKICQYKWEQKQNEKHRKRIKAIKTNIDNKAPAVYGHLLHKRKKEQLQEEVHQDREGEPNSAQGINSCRTVTMDVLTHSPMQKMSYIMTHSAIDNQNTVKPRSLNAGARRRELERIMAENQSLLKRIHNRKSTLSRDVWMKHHKDHQERLRILKDCDPRTAIKKNSSSRRKKTHKLGPLNRAGNRASASKGKGSCRKEAMSAKSKEKVVFKEGRLIEELYRVVTLTENKGDRIFSFQVYTLETSKNDRVDIPADIVWRCVDENLHSPEKREKLAVELIPRLQYIDGKLEFNSEGLRESLSEEKTCSSDKEEEEQEKTAEERLQEQISKSNAAQREKQEREESEAQAKTSSAENTEEEELAPDETGEELSLPVEEEKEEKEIEKNIEKETEKDEAEKDEAEKDETVKEEKVIEAEMEEPKEEKAETEKFEKESATEEDKTTPASDPEVKAEDEVKNEDKPEVKPEEKVNEIEVPMEDNGPTLDDDDDLNFEEGGDADGDDW
eukprot:1358043-Amorphochlora_amoeboformis.AAC.3